MNKNKDKIKRLKKQIEKNIKIYNDMYFAGTSNGKMYDMVAISKKVYKQQLKLNELEADLKNAKIHTK